MQGNCELSKCNHPNEGHKEGFCWDITNKELEHRETDEKYCPCGISDNIRRFAVLGYMVPRMEDHLMTKYCVTCGDPVLLKMSESVCNHCVILPE